MPDLTKIRGLLAGLKGRSTGSNIYRIVGADGELEDLPGNPEKGRVVILTSPKVMTIREFDLPTASSAQIRKILTANLMGYGAGAGLEIFPCITEKQRGHSKGFALCTSGEYLPNVEGRCWPGALALGGGLSTGTGITLWSDGEGISSVQWKDSVPIRTRYTRGGDTAGAAEWYRTHAPLEDGAEQETVIYEVSRPRAIGDTVERTLAGAHGLPDWTCPTKQSRPPQSWNVL